VADNTAPKIKTAIVKKHKTADALAWILKNVLLGAISHEPFPCQLSHFPLGLCLTTGNPLPTGSFLNTQSTRLVKWSLEFIIFQLIWENV